MNNKKLCAHNILEQVSVCSFLIYARLSNNGVSAQVAIHIFRSNNIGN